MLVTDRFSGRAAMYPVFASEFFALGTLKSLVQEFIRKDGCPNSLVTDNGGQFCPELSRAFCNMMRIRKLAASAYHARSSEIAERANDWITQMLLLVENERQEDWDEHLSHVESAHDSLVRTSTDFAPNVVKLGNFRYLALTIIGRRDTCGYQCLERNQLYYCDATPERQRLTCEFVREYHANCLIPHRTCVWGLE